MLLSSKFYGRDARFLQLSKDLFKVSSKITVMINDIKQFIDKVSDWKHLMPSNELALYT